MNVSLLGTLLHFLVSLMLTMTPSVTPLEPAASTKPPINKTLYVPIINDIRESKRTILLIASLPSRHLVIVSAPGSSTLTEALVFEQPPECLLYKYGHTMDSLTLRLETAPQLFTQKWPKLANLTSGATCVALRDNYQAESYTYLSRNEYLLIGDAGKLIFLHLDTGHLTQRTVNDSSLYGRLFADATLLSTFDEEQPMIFYRLLSRGSTHILQAEKVTFNSAEGQSLPGFESFSISEQEANYICPEGVQNSFFKCRKELNWSITYGFQSKDHFYLNEALTSFIIRTSGAIFEDTISNGSSLLGSGSGYSSFPLVDFWALEKEDIRDPEGQNGIYLGVALLLGLLAVAFVVFKYGCKGKGDKKGASSKQKRPRISAPTSKGSISRSKRSKSKKGSSSWQSTQA